MTTTYCTACGAGLVGLDLECPRDDGLCADCAEREYCQGCGARRGYEPHAPGCRRLRGSGVVSAALARQEGARRV